jgi:8-hydroxy-5-deazaflavin:NADPH oxidoreductase
MAKGLQPVLSKNFGVMPHMIMKTAIIGTGNIGSRLATLFADGLEGFLIADRDPAKAKALADSLGGKVHAVTIDEAIEQANIIVFAVWFESIKELLAEYRDKLHGKVVVDPSNPIAPDGNGGFKKIISADQSAGEVLSALLPKDAKFVKAFGTLGAESLASAAHRKPTRAVLFFASDDGDAGEEVERLISASGFFPWSIGGIDQSIRIEVFGDLHEFGKLGKLVTPEEAQAVLNQ